MGVPVFKTGEGEHLVLAGSIPVRLRSAARDPVDALPQQVGVAVVPCVLRDHVDDDEPQRVVLGVHRDDVVEGQPRGHLVGATCTATETIPAGYTANGSPAGTCTGGIPTPGECTITNTRNDTTFTVNKIWSPASGASGWKAWSSYRMPS